MSYTCDGCGACCRQLIVEIDETDIIREPRLIGRCRPFKPPDGMHLVDDDGEPYQEQIEGHGAGALLASGPSHACAFLEHDNTCGIYLTRPQVCVGMPPGGSQCQMARAMAGLPPLRARMSLTVVEEARA